MRERRGDRGGGAAVSSWAALPAVGGGRSARRRDWVPPGSVGSRGTAVSTCCAGLGRTRGARRPQPGLSPRLRPPEPRPLPSGYHFSPFHARARLPRGVEGRWGWWWGGGRGGGVVAAGPTRYFSPKCELAQPSPPRPGEGERTRPWRRRRLGLRATPWMRCLEPAAPLGTSRGVG